MRILKSNWKVVLSVIVEAAVIGGAFYTDIFRLISLPVQLLLIAVLASLHLWTGPLFDYLNLQRENLRLDSKNMQLQISTIKTQQELSDLQNVIVSFLEYSEIYKQKVKDYLKLNDDYLCIVKSSEGLSDVFNDLEEKEMLPFGSVLNRIQGAVKPFENMALFLIPVSSLPGITGKNIQRYIDKNILPEVMKERERFLGGLPKRIASKADEFSYKYIAFFLRRDSIVFDTLNRKFNHEFNSFIVAEQIGNNLGRMKTDLADVIRAKDLFLLVDWSAFAKLNTEQKSFVDKNKNKINEQLMTHGFVRLTDLCIKSEEEFLDAIWPVIRQKITKKKATNLVAKVVTGARSTVEILKQNGVNL